MRYNEIKSIINGLFKPSTRDDLSHLCSSLCIARGFSAMRASRWPNPSNWRVWNTSVQEKHGETIHVNSIDTKSPSVENNMPNFIEQNTPSYHISAQPFLLTSPGFTPLVSLSHPFQLGVQCSNDSNASSFFMCFIHLSPRRMMLRVTTKMGISGEASSVWQASCSCHCRFVQQTMTWGWWTLSKWTSCRSLVFPSIPLVCISTQGIHAGVWKISLHTCN